MLTRGSGPGAILEWLGRMLKERKPIPVSDGKGTANIELLELIRSTNTLIEETQTKRTKASPRIRRISRL